MQEPRPLNFRAKMWAEKVARHEALRATVLAEHCVGRFLLDRDAGPRGQRVLGLG